MNILKRLENIELAGITFIRDYIQFLFDGNVVLSTYTLPQIEIENKTISYVQYGYCDTLYSLIGKHVLSAYEDKKGNKIVIRFENNTDVTVSLNMEDRQSAEAAMLQVDNEEWNVW
ncbi:MAG: hypothetical protein LBV74_04400 [Tannerella sp.]|nr:hypothetical protein [Tannerella sp.]